MNIVEVREEAIMAKGKRQRSGGGYKTFACAVCGVTTTSRKSNACGTREDVHAPYPRRCRDKAACAQRVKEREEAPIEIDEVSDE